MEILTAAADALAAVFNHAAFGAAPRVFKLSKALGVGGHDACHYIRNSGFKSYF